MPADVLPRLHKPRGWESRRFDLGSTILLRDRERIIELEQVRGQVRYTTLEMLAVEQALLNRVAASQGMWVPKARPHQLAKLAHEYANLRPEQKDAVEHLICGIDRVCLHQRHGGVPARRICLASPDSSGSVKAAT